jgi:cytochrome b
LFIGLVSIVMLAVPSAFAAQHEEAAADQQHEAVGAQASHEGEDEHEVSVVHIVMQFALQLGVIILVAKIAGEITERYLKQPSVLGELVAGMIIGP